MNYTKQPLDFPQLLQLLKDRGLLIKDEACALEEFQIVSYFRLANYLRPMELDKTRHTFKPNSYFDNAIDLYYFDKELRSLLFTAIQSIEIALRSKVIHHFSMGYGAFWFMDQANFTDERIYNNCLASIQQELGRSKEDFIQDHLAKYSYPQLPPAWKTLEVVSFGLLSRLFCNFRNIKLKKAIAREFSLPQHVYLESWSKCAVVLRNGLAHHSRIWNRRFPLKPQLPQKMSGKWVDTTKIDPAKLYAQLCCLAYLQDHIHPDNDFKQRLNALLAMHPNVDVAAMGFPSDWVAQPLWQQA